MLLILGQRRIEVATMRWLDLDLDKWVKASSASTTSPASPPSRAAASSGWSLSPRSINVAFSRIVAASVELMGAVGHL
ncbi:hypothetical protein [Magnetospirillum sulfuroxidans]|uniref:Tyr recombinase domain-containing protein n=1 Tax=Magnetospirillum sulfuroxidans TaxID=611300 RepID=A0ABS5IGK7_9PROT|nr:hypothetical protein [Magnetospirillum sulfuroxidans]MBR9973567.1 hypothetical protein [Magnetospirillum sulfuroxidans]